MIVDLNPLPVGTAMDLIKMCVKYDIDKQKCVEIMNAMSVTPVPNIKWELDIPDKYLTLFLLKSK